MNEPYLELRDFPHSGHIKNIHLHSCKHKTVKLKLTLTLTLTDTGGTVLTLKPGYIKIQIAEEVYILKTTLIICHPVMGIQIQ